MPTRPFIRITDGTQTVMIRVNRASSSRYPDDEMLGPPTPLVVEVTFPPEDYRWDRRRSHPRPSRPPLSAAFKLWTSIHSFYLDDGSDSEEWFQLMQDRDLDQLSERDESAVEADKRASFPSFRMETPYQLVRTDDQIINKCELTEDKDNGGLLCKFNARNGSICRLSSKVLCTTIQIPNKASKCYCRLIEHIDKCPSGKH